MFHKKSKGLSNSNESLIKKKDEKSTPRKTLKVGSVSDNSRLNECLIKLKLEEMVRKSCQISFFTSTKLPIKIKFQSIKVLWNYSLLNKMTCPGIEGFQNRCGYVVYVEESTITFVRIAPFNGKSLFFLLIETLEIEKSSCFVGASFFI